MVSVRSLRLCCKEANGVIVVVVGDTKVHWQSTHRRRASRAWASLTRTRAFLEVRNRKTFTSSLLESSGTIRAASSAINEWKLTATILSRVYRAPTSISYRRYCRREASVQDETIIREHVSTAPRPLGFIFLTQDWISFRPRHHVVFLVSAPPSGQGLLYKNRLLCLSPGVYMYIPRFDKLSPANPQVC